MITPLYKHHSGQLFQLIYFADNKTFKYLTTIKEARAARAPLPRACLPVGRGQGPKDSLVGVFLQLCKSVWAFAAAVTLISMIKANDSHRVFDF